VEPSDFLSIDELTSLPDEAQADYVQAFLETFNQVPEDDHETKIAFADHFINLAEEFLSPADLRSGFARRFGIWLGTMRSASSK
jgi:hypothetical protein